MANDVFTFLVGGRAGQGVKKAGDAASHLFSRLGRHAFELDDYQSLIRGGHNFSVVSTAPREITSHYMKADLVVALDERSVGIHREHVADGGVLLCDGDESPDGCMSLPLFENAKDYSRSELRMGVAAVACLCAGIGLDERETAELVRSEYTADTENNVEYALTVFRLAAAEVGGRFELERKEGERPLLTGNQAIALGAAAAGLDFYAAYPMTPSSTILHFLAAHDEELGIKVVHPESEIAVANMAIGAAAAGARAAVGTSGGGYALMEEAFSLAGMSETPLLAARSSRPGPSTGVPTYTEQADLEFAMSPGHGEFARILASPGSIAEAYRLAAQLMELAWRFQVVATLLTEKHLSESQMTVELDPADAAWADPDLDEGEGYARYRQTESGVSPLRFFPSEAAVKWNSYEHDEQGITTEDAELVAAMHDKRLRKERALEKHLEGLSTVNRFGGEGPVVVTYGSTTMSVLEALRAGDLDARVVQPVFLRPWPAKALRDIEGREVVVVEQSATGQFARLLSEKTRAVPKRVIKRYDGRPFEPLELATQLGEALSELGEEETS